MYAPIPDSYFCRFFNMDTMLNSFILCLPFLILTILFSISHHFAKRIIHIHYRRWYCIWYYCTVYVYQILLPSFCCCCILIFHAALWTMMNENFQQNWKNNNNGIVKMKVKRCWILSSNDALCMYDCAKYQSTNVHLSWNTDLQA